MEYAIYAVIAVVVFAGGYYASKKYGTKVSAAVVDEKAVVAEVKTDAVAVETAVTK